MLRRRTCLLTSSLFSCRTAADSAGRRTAQTAISRSQRLGPLLESQSENKNQKKNQKNIKKEKKRAISTETDHFLEKNQFPSRTRLSAVAVENSFCGGRPAAAVSPTVSSSSFSSSFSAVFSSFFPFFSFFSSFSAVFSSSSSASVALSDTAAAAVVVVVVAGGGGAFHRSPVLRYRNVVANTLADTPSGYIQDPRLHPARMVSYRETKLSPEKAALLEALAAERALREKAELVYKGYTTDAIQHAKSIVLNPNASNSAVEEAVVALRREREALLRHVGREVDKPLSKEEILLLKWQQRQRRLADQNGPFRRREPAKAAFTVHTAEDGTEELVLAKHNGGGDVDDESSSLWDGVEDEVVDPDLLTPERVVVKQGDANHVRYVLGLGLRRLAQFDEAESVNLDILRNDVRNVDATESLLELYTGTGDNDKIQALFEFLEKEFDTASREGRLSHVGVAEGEAEVEAAGETAESGTAANGDGSEETELPTGETALSNGHVLLAEGTTPLVTPAEIAVAMLADMIVEAGTRHCAEHGEGSTTRFFLQLLGPIGKSLNRTYMTMLIEALFRSMDEQHYVARFELDADELARNGNLIYSVVISFLKMLLVTRIPSMVEDPIRFRFAVLSKLHSALRSSKRRGESYRFCEEMLKLYRANSSVYQQRMRALAHAKTTAVESGADGVAAIGDVVESETGCEMAKDDDEDKRKTNAMEQPTRKTGNDAAPRSSSSSPPPPAPLPLDDMDDAYRNSLFQYLNDRAMDSTVVGRELCLRVMEEFPQAAAPWETFALILHREDPKGNLHDAILAARNGLQLEPFNLSLILTCANFYKADHRYALYELIMDRYRLLCYMLENAASEDDLRSVAAEILDAEKDITENTEDVKLEELRFRETKLRDQPALLRAMEEWARTHSHTHSPRTYTHQQPVTAPSQELDISTQRPPAMGQEFRDLNDAFGRRGGGSD